MKQNNLYIPFDSYGLRNDATEESKEVVKELYYALKKENLFYHFQRVFYPLKGLTSTQLVPPRYSNTLMGLKVGDIVIFNTGVEPIKLYRRLSIIDLMLQYRHYDNRYDIEDEGSKTLTKYDVLECYVRHYCRDKKAKPSGIIVRFAFGIFFMLLFTISLFLALGAMMPSIGKLLCIFVLLTVTICLIYVICNRKYDKIQGFI